MKTYTVKISNPASKNNGIGCGHKHCAELAARRDANFEALQTLRKEGAFVAMKDGYMLEI